MSREAGEVKCIAQPESHFMYTFQLEVYKEEIKFFMQYQTPLK